MVGDGDCCDVCKSAREQGLVDLCRSGQLEVRMVNCRIVGGRQWGW